MWQENRPLHKTSARSYLGTRISSAGQLTAEIPGIETPVLFGSGHGEGGNRKRQTKRPISPNSRSVDLNEVNEVIMKQPAEAF